VTAPGPPPTRDRLLAAATDLIEEGGYAAASVAAIAARAGVSAGALYRHFPSKAELFVEVFRAHAQRELAAMHAAGDRTTSFTDRLAAVVETYATSALGNRRLAWALVYEPVDPLVDAERLAHRKLYRNQMAELLRLAMAAGELPPHDDPDLLAAVVVGGIAEALAGPLSPVAAEADERHVARAIVDLALRTVGAASWSPTAT
jgi:AcrR family transcriptional regulator